MSKSPAGVEPSVPVDSVLPAAKAKPVDAELKARVSNIFGKLPIRFEANQGQTDPGVKFLARGPNYALFLTPRSAVMTVPLNASGSVKHVSSETRRAVVRMSLLDANPAPEMLGENQQVTRSNYLVGSDATQWRTGVVNYGKVRYLDAYPGIDMLYYGNPRKLEYDFVVSPGVDPKIIRLQFQGQEGLELDDRGNLILKFKDGRIVQNAPVVYQNEGDHRVPVLGQYTILGENTVGFEIGDYDPEKQLVIDPTLTFSTYFGGSTTTEILGMYVDSSGNIYVAGFTQSTDFPTAGSPLQSSNAGGLDVFVAKFNSSASTLTYSTYLGGSATDQVSDIAVDSSGNAYLLGVTASSDFPLVSAYDFSLGGTDDAFVALLNSNGSALTYSTYLGGSGSETPVGIAVDSSGNAYLLGRTGSTDFPTAGSPIQSSNAGSQDVFVTKINSSGSALTYSTYLGGSASEYPNDIVVDSSGNVYIAGRTFSSDFTTSSAYDSTFEGSSDGFVAKINASGSALTFSTYLGGASSDAVNGIAVDSSGNVYVTGATGSSDFPTAGSPYQSSKAGGDDAFVTKFDSSGSSLTYSTYLGGSTDDESGSKIAVDSSGNVYIGGRTASTDFPTVDPLYSTFNAEVSNDLFIAQLDSSGSTLLFSTYMGSANTDSLGDIVVDSSGNIYISGYATDSDFPTTSAYDSTYGGTGQDGIIAKIDPSPTVAFDATSSSGAESTTSVSLSVSLSTAAGFSVTVDYALTGTATGSGTDYTLADGTLTFSAGTTTQNISVTVVDDTTDENDETIILTLSNPSNATLGTNTVHTYTITDDDSAPAVAFDATSSSGAEATTPATLAVSLSNASAISTITVNYTITGTATGSGTDYTLVNGTLTFNAGTTTQNISATIVDDSTDESDETIIVTLSNPSTSLGTNTTHTYIIADNDSSTVSVFFNSDASSQSESTTSANLPVSLSGSSASEITVDYAVTGGTATGNGIDYTLASGTLTFSAGTTTQNISLTIVDDLEYEFDDEIIIVTLSNPSNASLGSITTHTYTITEDEVLIPTLSEWGMLLFVALLLFSGFFILIHRIDHNSH